MPFPIKMYTRAKGLYNEIFPRACASHLLPCILHGVFRRACPRNHLQVPAVVSEFIDIDMGNLDSVLSGALKGPVPGAQAEDVPDNGGAEASLRIRPKRGPGQWRVRYGRWIRHNDGAMQPVRTSKERRNELIRLGAARYNVARDDVTAVPTTSIYEGRPCRQWGGLTLWGR